MTPKSIAHCIARQEQMAVAETQRTPQVGDQIIFWIFTFEMVKKYRTGTICESGSAVIGENKRTIYKTAEAPHLPILFSQICRVINPVNKSNFRPPVHSG